MNKLVFLAALAAAAGLFLIQHDGSPATSHPDVPVVDQAVLDRALFSQVPNRLPGSDELDFFRRRADERGADILAERRTVAALLQRFQGYANPADLDEAEALNQRLLEERPGDAALWATKASIELSRHRFRSARAAARRAVELAPVTDGAFYRLRLFDTYLAAGLYDEAEDLLRLQHDRGSFQYIVRQARLADRTGDVESARELMERALELTRAYAQPRLVLAWNLVELGHFEFHSGSPRVAASRYLEALGVAPGYPAALEGLGSLAYGVDRNGHAAESLFHSAMQNGGHPDLLLRLADVASYNGRSERAAHYRRSLLEAAQQDAALTRLLARPLVHAAADADPLRALELAQQDLAERPTAESWATYGWVLHNLGRHDVASTAFERAMAWGTPEPSVFYLAGKAALDRGDEALGRGLLRQALDARAELGPKVTDEIEKLLG